MYKLFFQTHTNTREVRAPESSAQMRWRVSSSFLVVLFPRGEFLLLVKKTPRFRNMPVSLLRIQSVYYTWFTLIYAHKHFSSLLQSACALCGINYMSFFMGAMRAILPHVRSLVRCDALCVFVYYLLQLGGRLSIHLSFSLFLSYSLYMCIVSSSVRGQAPGISVLVGRRAEEMRWYLLAYSQKPQARYAHCFFVVAQRTLSRAMSRQQPPELYMHFIRTHKNKAQTPGGRINMIMLA